MRKQKKSLIIFSAFIFLANLLLLDYQIFFSKKNKPAEVLIPLKEAVTPKIKDVSCPFSCLNKINEATSSLNLLSSEKIMETVVEKQAPVINHNNPKEFYIPIDGSGSTTNGSWIDIPGMEIYINRDKYPDNVSVEWEASLKVKDNNGEAHARLFNVNKNGAVDYSEITAIGSSYKRVASNKINLTSSNNLYRVQMFSTTQYEVSIQGAKIKITVE